jgi:hypothetical protein
MKNKTLITAMLAAAEIASPRYYPTVDTCVEIAGQICRACGDDPEAEISIQVGVEVTKALLDKIGDSDE